MNFIDKKGIQRYEEIMKTTHTVRPTKNSRDQLRFLYRNLTLAAQKLEEMKYVVGLRLGKHVKYLEVEEAKRNKEAEQHEAKC